MAPLAPLLPLPTVCLGALPFSLLVANELYIHCIDNKLRSYMCSTRCWNYCLA